MTRHYSDEEVTRLRERAEALMQDLAAVFDAIVEKVTALEEDKGGRPDGESAAGAVAAVEALRHEHRGTGG